MRFPEVVLASADEGLTLVLLSPLLAFIVTKKGANTTPCGEGPGLTPD